MDGRQSSFPRAPKSSLLSPYKDYSPGIYIPVDLQGDMVTVGHYCILKCYKNYLCYLQGEWVRYICTRQGGRSGVCGSVWR